eukprot:CAMPEP_0179125478 /NCGR_PEP_ID=MMETSP0796-20121207/59345_1 /TAXON_ID=73915 /ORGANISM="Pyrodinium bahamense, Strain pbaha01" /LENGTH=278 /DNA_ID=CAMNT_0020824179 /DNA_START=79 /DNA_END=915 /DNA_ORIENTATION=-
MADSSRPAAAEILAVFRAYEEAKGGAIMAPELATVLKQVAKIDDGEVAHLLSASGLGGPSCEGPVPIEDFVRWVFAEEVASADESAVGPEVVFVLGGPGCGKGTFSTRVVEQFGFKHLSAGDLLRAERQRPGSSVGELIEARIKEGRIVPSEITVGLLEQEMRRLGWEGGKYLVDGFPRNLDNAQAWENILARRTRLRFCLVIECSQECMERRLLHRGLTSGRSDDNIETIRKRFVTFQEESVPVLERFEREGLVRKVNSEPGIDAVWHEVETIFSKL